MVEFEFPRGVILNPHLLKRGMNWSINVKVTAVIWGFAMVLARPLHPGNGNREH